jgi:hypothetical protein
MWRSIATAPTQLPVTSSNTAIVSSAVIAASPSIGGPGTECVITKDRSRYESPYETQDEALRLATDAAEQLERHGEIVEVHLVGLS